MFDGTSLTLISDVDQYTKMFGSEILRHEVESNRYYKHHIHLVLIILIIV